MTTIPSDLQAWFARARTAVAGNEGNLTVSSYDRGGALVAQWQIRGALPTHYKMSIFDGDGTESLTVTHDGFERVK